MDIVLPAPIVFKSRAHRDRVNAEVMRRRKAGAMQGSSFMSSVSAAKIDAKVHKSSVFCEESDIL